MFTWICPQCGREVPPAYNDCPDCTQAAKAGGAPGAAPAREAAGQKPAQAAPVPPPRPEPAAAPPAWQYPPPPPPQAPPVAPPQQAWQAPPQQWGPPPQPAWPPPQQWQPQPPPPQGYGPPPEAPPQPPAWQSPPQQWPPPQQQWQPPQQAYSPAPEAPPQQWQPPQPPQQAYSPVTEAPPQQPAPAPLRSWDAPPPAQRRGLPTWLMAMLFAAGFVGLGTGLYWLVGSRGKPAAPTAAVESPAAKPGAKTNPIQKFIEVSGVRFTEEGRKKVLSVKYLVINHSGAEITGLAGNVTVWGRTQKSEEDAAGTFSFQTTLGPYESKELTSPLNTKLKVYELPDWQNVSTDIQITAPAGG